MSDDVEIEIELTPEQMARIERAVAAGLYADANEFVCAALQAALDDHVRSLAAQASHDAASALAKGRRSSKTETTPAKINPQRATQTNINTVE